jgi:type III secretion system HrpE/YscL family protein
MSANVIKVHVRNVHPSAPTIKKAVREASLDAKDIVAQARSQAAEIVANAEREKEAIAEESRTHGYSEGLYKWNETLAEAWRARDRYFTGNEAELVKLAVTIARKIVGDCSRTDPGALLHTAREAIRAVRNERKIRLRVRATDEAFVRQRIAELQAVSAETCEIAVVVDDTITLGGCLVESDVGTIDAQFSTQLASLERLLLRGVESDGN